MRLRSFLVTLVLIFSCQFSRATDVVELIEHGGIAYLLIDSEARIERYDLTNSQWLSTITLPPDRSTPTALHIDDDGIFVAYGSSAFRTNLAGNSEVHLTNVSAPIHGIFSDGNLLILNYSSGLYTRSQSIDKNDNSILDSYENYVESAYGSAIAPSINRILGRSRGISPADITYTTYDEAGIFLTSRDSPHHGDYPNATRVWVFPNDGRVVDDSGSVYNSRSLEFVSSVPGAIDELAFSGVDIPVILRGSTLTSYSNNLQPRGSHTLSFIPDKFAIHQNNIVTFTINSQATNGVQVNLFALATLDPATPGLPVNPRGAVFKTDQVFLGTDGIVYLYNKAHQSIFRWNPATQLYEESIPLIGVPEFVAYTPSEHKIYLAYRSGLIRRINLADDPLEESTFASLPEYPLGLATAGPYVFSADPSGSWISHYTFDAAGNLVDSEDFNYRSDEYIWNGINQKMYFFRDDSSPIDLLWEEINADGTSYPSEAPGGIGESQDSPLHGSAGFNHPIRVSPDGSTVVLGSGEVHDGITLERSPNALGNAINDASWLSGNLRTIRTVADATEYQAWLSPGNTLQSAKQYPGEADRLLALTATEMLGISIGENAVPMLTILDDNFDVVTPASLPAPFGLDLSIPDVTGIRVQWIDISGETEYTVERRLAGGNWSTLVTTNANVTSLLDTQVSPGNTYFYRVTAKSGSLSSPASGEAGMTFAAPLQPSNLSSKAISSSEIQVAWEDVDRETEYTLERRYNLGSWFEVATLDSDNGSYLVRFLSSNSTFDFRIKARNPLGESPYSLVITETTLPEPPAAPTLFTPTASANRVDLSWSNPSNEENFVIERSPAGTFVWTTIATVGEDIASYSDSTVSPETSYDYRVKAVNSLYESDYSNLQTVTTPPLPLPLTPSYFSARTNSESEIQILWADASYETSYRLERSVGNDTSWVFLSNVPQNSTGFVDNSLTAGTPYYYRVQSVNPVGSSAFTQPAMATPAPITRLLDDDFDPDIETGTWNNTSGGTVVNGGEGFAVGNALWFGGAGTRQAQSVALNTTLGGTLEFSIRAGNQSVDGSDYWNNSESGEQVVLEYSLNGTNWLTIATIDTLYPALSSWEKRTVVIPGGAISSATRFRWRQVKHNGATYDTWALDDVSVIADTPPAPSAPTTITANGNASTEITVSWNAALHAATYLLERSLDGEAWAVQAGPTSSRLITDSGLSPGTQYFYRVKARNDVGDSPYTATVSRTTLTEMENWRFQNFGTSEDTGQAASDWVGDDGVSNLMKFASNLDADEAPVLLDPETGTEGLPNFYYDHVQKKLCGYYLRRKASTQPDITYTVMVSDGLDSWSAGGQATEVESINSEMERVTWEDSVTSNGASRRFVKLVVTED